MKKISKILLPIGTIAAVSTGVTPLVSCGQSSKIDLLNYVPDPSTKHNAEALTDAQATKACFGQSNSIAIVKQDIVRYLSWQVKYEFYALVLALELGYEVTCAGVPNSASCQLSNLSLSYDDNHSFARLSGIIELEVNIDVYNPSVPTTYRSIGTLTVKTRHEIENMKYVMGYNELVPTNKYWIARIPGETELKEDDSWYVKAHAESKINYFDQSIDPDEKEYEITYNKDYQEDMSKLALLTWWSYHLIDCTKS